VIDDPQAGIYTPRMPRIRRIPFIFLTLLAASALFTLRASDEGQAVAARPAFVATDNGTYATRGAPAPGARVRAGDLIVAFRPTAGGGAIDRALQGAGIRAARRGSFGVRYLATVDESVGTARALERLRSMDEVDYAEVNGTVHKSAPTTFHPNDPRFNIQWNFTMIGAERMWGIQKGSPSVGVAVLDTGIAFEDYADPVTRQQFRKALDWGGMVFLPGYDFVNGDAHANDDEYHGTHVASTVAQATNNNLSFAGLAFNCSLMPVKVLDAEGTGTYFDVADGIDYAVNFSQNGTRPVKVINLSLGGPGSSEDVRRAVDRAIANGVVVVASAGNESKGSVDFPASLANVIAVGAVDARKQKAPYSNFGPEVSVVAPGGDCDRNDSGNSFGADCVWQQGPHPDFVAQGRYDVFVSLGLDGTSMAAPHVSALAALLASQGITDPAAIRAAIEQTAERLGGAPAGGRNDTFGNGLIQPARALSGLGFNQGPND
jgi:serine protease